MKDRDKNRDPERALARAFADARCALRKIRKAAEDMGEPHVAEGFGESIEMITQFEGVVFEKGLRKTKEGDRDA